MIRIEEWLMIRNLYNQGLSKSEISRRLGIHRETVSNNLQKSLYMSDIDTTVGFTSVSSEIQVRRSFLATQGRHYCLGRNRR